MAAQTQQLQQTDSPSSSAVPWRSQARKAQLGPPTPQAAIGRCRQPAQAHLIASRPGASKPSAARSS
eukprot:1045419-Pyramimonas_sp.AAC.1